jgi:hypothetical protein
MGQLDILTAQSIAAERESALSRTLEARRTAAQRGAGTATTVSRARRYGLLERLHLVHHPAR